jgi:hypothetical protein
MLTIAPPPLAASTGAKARHMLSVPKYLVSISARAASKLGALMKSPRIGWHNWCNPANGISNSALTPEICNTRQPDARARSSA